MCNLNKEELEKLTLDEKKEYSDKQRKIIIKQRNTLEVKFSKETVKYKREDMRKEIIKLTEVANNVDGSIVELRADTFLEGEKAENRFAHISKMYNCKHEHATKGTDMFKHVDCFISRENEDKLIGVDVKGIKRNFRQGDKDDSIIWVEHRNIHGFKGWLFGKADIIAQEFKDGFYLINREDLAAFSKKKLINAKTFVKKNWNDNIPLNEIYERKGKKYPTKYSPSTISDDMIMKLSIEEVRKECRISVWKY